MQVQVLLECPADRVAHVARLGAAAGTPLYEDDERVGLRYELGWAASQDELMSDPSRAWRELHEYVKALCGACSLFDERSDNDVRVHNVYFVDHEGSRRWLPITGQLHVTLGVLVAGSNDDRTRLVGNALKRDDAAKVMRLLAEKQDWTNLYRIFEVIKCSVGGEKAISDQGWASKREMNAFTGSANHPGVSGDASRHGVPTGETPRRVVDLRVATALVRRLARHYLEFAGRQGKP